MEKESEIIEVEPELDMTKPSIRETSDYAPRSQSTVQVIAEKYEILDKLGSGGISSVFRVKHLHLNRIYALKLLHELKPESVLRFQQEAKASSLLQHEHIVGIVDFGVFDGKPYMVMNCVEGQTLSQYAKNNPQTNPLTWARIFGEIAAALAHAHEKGVVHRDIKPSNIMISFDENQVEHAIVVDFGIAKIITEHPENFNSQLTRTGDIFGTPLYMSPEQCKGLAVDARSDIYSLGCVMYEVLTGEPPFRGNSPYEVIHKQITAAPKPFSSELLKSQIMAKMEGIILKAMAKSAEDRFQYMLEMSSAIKAVELGARKSGFRTSGWNVAVARLRASDKQQTVLKLSIGFSSILCALFAIAILFLPQQIEKLAETSAIKNQIIAQSNDIFTLRFDQDASLYRIKRSEIKVKLAKLKELASFDKQISERCDALAKATIIGADKIHDLRGMRRAITDNDPSGSLAHLLTLKEKVNEVEFRLGEATNLWSIANQKSIDLTNSLSKQIEIEDHQKSFLNIVLLSSRFLILPTIALLLLSIYMIVSSRRKEKSWNANNSFL